MTTLIKVAALSIVAVSFSLLIKEYRPELALQASIIAGVAVLLMVFGEIGGVVSQIESFIEQYSLDTLNISILLKVTGMAYIAQFAIQICHDAKENAIASKVEIAARVFIIAASFPIFRSVLEMLLSTLPLGD